MVTSALIDRYMDILDDYEAVTTAQYITDSLGCMDIPVVRRERYFLMQSPEAFRFKLLEANMKADSDLTELIQQLPTNTAYYRNYDFTDNYKLTYPDDIYILEKLLAKKKN
jgi:2-C-methyl-D-erythritol 4-phosphate cytidylyltransferase